MFTGLVEEIGVCQHVVRSPNGKVIALKASGVHDGLVTGASVAVNGVCLTVTRRKKDVLFFDVMGETLTNSTLGSIVKGRRVNIERSLSVGGEVGGHFVYGHIDGTRRVKAVSFRGPEQYMDIAITAQDKPYVVTKGSVAIDGVSLTVGRVFEDYLRVFIIPHTVSHTTLGDRKTGDRVNVEFDIIGKHAVKTQTDRRVTRSFLDRTGFTG